MTDKKKNNFNNYKTMAITIVVAIVCSLILSAAIVYLSGSQNKFAKKISRIIPFPATIIGTNVVTIAELDGRLDSARRFYENQNFSDIGLKVDFSTPEGKKRLVIKEKYVLNKAIEDKIIEIEAKKMGIKLDKEDVDQEVSRTMKESGTGNVLLKDLEKLYGWNLDDFKEKIVLPDMYREKLFMRFRDSDESFPLAMEKIKKAKEELEQKKDFMEVAKKYSDGDSAISGGDLGWFSEEEMLPEISAIAFNMEKGKRSEIIESSLGYHILRLDDRKNEDGLDKVKISQIFARTKQYSDWILEESKDLSIWLPLKNYKWNREKGEVEFTSQELIKFEEELDQNSQGDISIMF